MKIIVDENIAFASEAFGSLGEIKLVPGRNLENKQLGDAEVLIVRSITKVNEELLKGSKIRFVGTATIGTDHIDKEYLKTHGITFADAAGCNAFSVAEYVFSAIFSIYNKHGISLEGKSLGVIGVGNVGSKVARMGEALGLKVLKNDPPLQRLAGGSDYCTLEEALNADIVTCHVPLNKTGIDKTVHLINEENINMLHEGTLLINSSRGPVVDNSILKNFMIKNKIFAVLDVWEGEPNLDTELLSAVDIASSHIAGYSMEGKVNGTVLVYNKLCDFLGIQPKWTPNYPPIAEDKFAVNNFENSVSMFDSLFKRIYDIQFDNNLMKNALKVESTEIPKYFDSLRKNYRVRREFSNYKLKVENLTDDLKKILNAFRFQLLN